MADTVNSAQSGERDVSIYLACRAVAAIVNVLSVALFTRLSSPDLYGQYLIGFSICFIVYSLTVQWAVYAHFGTFRQEAADRFALSLVVISALALAPALLSIGALAGLGILEGHIAWGSAVLALCLALHFAGTEVSRSHLKPGLVAIATISRSVLSLLLGSASLILFHEPAALLVAVGLGYALGAVPVYVHFARSLRQGGLRQPLGAEIAAMLRYGWPLAIAFGASAAAMNIDRILLEHHTDAATVAPYGAVMDLMKQTFLVLAEAISAGYVAHARIHMMRGETQAARAVLKRDFVSQAFVVVFGTVAFILLGRLVFSVVLAPAYLDMALDVLPALLVGNALLVLRAHYFGQVIYLGASSLIELVASLVMIAAAAGAALLLIDAMGAHGAALAFAIGQAAALLVYVVGAPKALRMPVDWLRGGLLLGVGGAILAGGLEAQALFGPAVGTVFCVFAIGVASLVLAMRWNIFNLSAMAQKLASPLLGLLPKRGL
ncbi:hypothetical protein [Rhizobium sp. CSW-27]|uniref:lipopolysaccharide biosynthesis protein n=1 Tax=Rhizobium sp. CSW-27 TaxID=2839985 RepID=UPI001C01C47A|nr:hypothetical protein [Rhizobium sp. CSW-27]MBT9372239.1 hypothetical protein [Rhizobium sp. CSW-27]